MFGAVAQRWFKNLALSIKVLLPLSDFPLFTNEHLKLISLIGTSTRYTTAVKTGFHPQTFSGGWSCFLVWVLCFLPPVSPALFSLFHSFWFLFFMAINVLIVCWICERSFFFLWLEVKYLSCFSLSCLLNFQLSPRMFPVKDVVFVSSVANLLFFILRPVCPCRDPLCVSNFGMKKITVFRP